MSSSPAGRTSGFPGAVGNARASSSPRQKTGFAGCWGALSEKRHRTGRYGFYFPCKVPLIASNCLKSELQVHSAWHSRLSKLWSLLASSPTTFRSKPITGSARNSSTLGQLSPLSSLIQTPRLQSQVQRDFLSTPALQQAHQHHHGRTSFSVTHFGMASQAT